MILRKLKPELGNEEIEMYEKLKGKKLLIVGSAFESEIVKAAHEMGVYVIVVDNILDRKEARAKELADAAWDISYFDTDAIVQKCMESGVDGVFAGYGETRVIAAYRIAKTLGKPFYATEEQINITRDKKRFKEECIRYGVPVPRSYCAGNIMTGEEKENVIYPVIVKPSDRSGRIGISVCNNRQELDAAIEFALSKSETKAIVVEEYLEGTEFSAIYTVKNGISSLSCVNAKYITDDQTVPNLLCDCAMAPAVFVNDFKSKIDSAIADLLNGIGMKNGMANFQGMVTEKGIIVFETGLRINGNNDWKIIEKNNGINFAKMLMAYSLCGDMCDDLSKDTPFFKRYYCTLPFYAHGGIIAKLEFDKVLAFDWAEISTQNAGVGTEILEDCTGRQKVIAFLIEADNYEQLLSRIREVQKNVVVENEAGISLLFKNFNPNKIADKL